MSRTGNSEYQSVVKRAENDIQTRNDFSSEQPLQCNEKTVTERNSRNDIETSKPDDAVISEKETSKPAGAGSVQVDADQSEKEQSDDSGPANPLKKTATSASDKPYSVFTLWQKRFIILASSVGTFISPLTSNIYFPALNTIASDLHVSVSQINLTITTYMVRVSSFIPAPCMHHPVLMNTPDLPRPGTYVHWWLLRQCRKTARVHYRLHHLPRREHRPSFAKQLRSSPGAPLHPKHWQQRHGGDGQRSSCRLCHIRGTWRLHWIHVSRNGSRAFSVAHSWRSAVPIPGMEGNLLVSSHLWRHRLHPLPHFLPRNMSESRRRRLRPAGRLQPIPDLLPKPAQDDQSRPSAQLRGT